MCIFFAAAHSARTHARGSTHCTNLSVPKFQWPPVCRPTHYVRFFSAPRFSTAPPPWLLVVENTCYIHRHPPQPHTHDTRNIGTRAERNITHWKTISYRENERKNIAEKSTEPTDKNERGGGYKGGTHPTGRVYILMWNSRSYAKKTVISHARARHTFFGVQLRIGGTKEFVKREWEN